MPWHNQDQEEIYFVVEGEREDVPGRDERVMVHGGGKPVYIPPRVFPSAHEYSIDAHAHDLLLRARRDVAHWRQELEGTLPRAGVEVEGASQGRASSVHRKAEGMTYDAKTLH